MSHHSEQFAHLSPLKQALLALEDLQTRLNAVERRQTEAIAIIGIGCRFPNANNLDQFWQLLHNGVDAIADIPRDRWNIDAYYNPNPETAGTMYTRQGGFLAAIDQFDADFFGLAPREVVNMDPQQRLLLEVSWEALENAAIAPNTLKESRTGVFIGINNNDYARLLASDQSTESDAYFFTGNTFSVAAGRLAYLLGLQGPTLAVDTACSSSLAAVHLACQSLRTGECHLALAGGVNLIVSPQGNIVLSKMRALSADGRCKTFDATADGYGRGEGCGIVVLKRLSDAVADGDRILALVQGTAMNHDGRTGGLTVPNGLAQQKLIRTALANANIKPDQVSYVEVHGTGTSLGDPIEVDALAAVFGQARSHDQPLAIGSVKTNIGHLEAAAGIAGLVKVVLALQHQELPPHLHLRTPNPVIPWKDLPFIVPTKPTVWSARGQQRCAGVSSFGMSGTNVHLVLGEAPIRQLAHRSSTTRLVERPQHLLTLSAKSNAALKELAQRYADCLKTYPNWSLADVCFTANTGRSHFNHRLAVLAESTSELHERLAAFATGQGTATLARGEVQRDNHPKIAFLFAEQGTQLMHIGRQLYETQPLFRQVLDRCDAILRPYLETSLQTVLYSTDTPEHAFYTRLALFSIEYALANLWRSWGINPDAVMGQGVGEYVAACLAGVFSLEEGLQLVAEWDQSMQPLPDLETTESAQIPFILSRTGRTAESISQPDYSHPTQKTAQFAAGVQSLSALGCDVFIEIGLDAMLSEMGQQCLPEKTWLPSFQHEQCNWQQLLTSLATLYVRGVEVNWREFDRHYERDRLPLPTYPFQRSRYWMQSSDRSLTASQSRLFQDEFYKIEWQLKTRSESDTLLKHRSLEPGSWLIFTDQEDDVGTALVALLKQRGETCFVVVPGETYAVSQAGNYQINPLQLEDFQQVLNEVLSSDRPCRGIVHLWSLSSTHTANSLSTDQALSCGSVLHLVQALANRKTESIRLWLVTQNAQPAGSEAHTLSVAQSALWGLGRTIALEHPECWGGLVDLASGAAENMAALLFQELWQPEVENQIAFYEGQRYVPRLIHHRESRSNDWQVRSDGTYLITGGLGGLGLQLTKWLVEQGARHLVLVSRRSASENASQVLNELRTTGTHIVVMQADIAQEAQVAQVFADIAQSQPPLRGVFHLAGVLDDGVLLRQDWQRFANVMTPKAVGAWNLHLHTRSLSLDCFVLFSSIASVLGSPGQGNYAAANAVLDGLAHYRRSRGLPALCLNWSPWAETGMAAALGDSGEQRWSSVGLRVLDPQMGMQMLETLLRQDVTQMSVLPVVWSTFLQQFPTHAQPPLFADIVKEGAVHPTSQTSDFLQQLQQASDSQRQGVLVAQLQREVAAVLRRDPSDIRSQMGFFDMGMDSLMTLELKNRLQTSFGQSLPSTLTFDYPTIEILAEYLLSQVSALEPSADTIPPSSLVPPDLLADIQQLSDDELTALIDQELETLVAGN